MQLILGGTLRSRLSAPVARLEILRKMWVLGKLDCGELSTRGMLAWPGSVNSEMRVGA